MVELDEVDRVVLHELQLDARNTTTEAIAEVADVSASTVRNRIDRLESSGVIEGYYPKVNYEEAELPLQILFVCSAPPAERTALVDDLLEVRGVVDVRETLTGRHNLYVEAVGTDTRDADRVTAALHETGISVEESEIVRQHQSQPFNHFGAGAMYDEDGDESDADEPT